MRKCGDCTLCCKLVPVRELHKPANTRCEHQSAARGCRIYHQTGFPASCAVWSCRWLTGHDTADMLRPDRAGYVIDSVPDVIRMRSNETGQQRVIPIVQVWVDPDRRLEGDRRLFRYAERQAEEGVALLLRYSSTEAKALIAPAISGDGQWYLVGGERMTRVETQTGNLLLDSLLLGAELEVQATANVEG